MINLIFGKKKLVKTKILGTFEARVKKHSNRKKSWISTIEVEGYSKEIVIILEGDSNGPFVKQIESASRIINELKELDQKIISKIYDNNKLKAKFGSLNLKEFRLACLNPWDESRNSFELSYESKLDDSNGLSVILESGQIIEIE